MLLYHCVVAIPTYTRAFNCIVPIARELHSKVIWEFFYENFKRKEHGKKSRKARGKSAETLPERSSEPQKPKKASIPFSGISKFTMSSEVEAKHRLHSGIFHPVLRQWQATNLEITPSNLMYPIFILDNPDAKDEIKSMPGVFRYGINQLKCMLQPLVAKGLKSVLLFGVVSDHLKDSAARNSDSPLNPVMQALPLLRQWFPDLVIACDVCLCPYTNHGHCGILHEDGIINNAPSIQRIAEIAVAYGRAGAHIIAPSDMMDGRIGAIKQGLVNAGLENRVAVLSYSVKFASGFYGPFRDAANSAPQFGDRKSYQLPPGSVGLAARAAARDIAEGADMLMVKPGLPYIDIMRSIKETYPHHPMFIYQVSGEYAMLYHGAKNGAVDLKDVLKEILVSMRRAGADCIISYFTPLILDMLQPTSKY